MRSSIVYLAEKSGTFKEIQNELAKLLPNSPRYFFNMIDADNIDKQTGESVCILKEEQYEDDEEDEESKTYEYPDIFSNESILGGPTLFKLFINNKTIIPYPITIVDPTWRDVLTLINNVLEENNLNELVLYNINLVGLIEEGMGYEAEIVMVDPNSEYI